MEIGHRRASKSSTDAFASLSGFSYPDVRFQAIKWVIISDLWYNLCTGRFLRGFRLAEAGAQGIFLMGTSRSTATRKTEAKSVTQAPIMAVPW